MPTLSEIFAIVVAALLGVILIMGITIYVEGDKIDTLSAQKAAADGANAQMDVQIIKQNAAVASLKADEAALTASAAKAQKQAAKRDAGLAARIATLKSAKLTGDACADANGLLNTYLAGSK